MKVKAKVKIEIRMSQELVEKALEHFYGEVNLHFILSNALDERLRDEIKNLINMYGEDAIVYLPETSY
jgi:hypothetical protein